MESSDETKFFAIQKASMSVPGVRINRTEFLRKELSKHFFSDIVNLAVEKNPAYAGISVEKIDKIAKSCINFETGKVSLISTVACIPGGFAMIGTIPADTVQYFAHVVRILQKLVYLYGWKELYNSESEFDDETSNKLTIFMGVMFGVSAANKLLAKTALVVAQKIEKDLVNKTLTKGVVYPIVKKIAQILGSKMTKRSICKRGR